MNKVRKWAVMAFGLMAVSIAVAVSYGKWFCESCEIEQSITSGTISTEIADVYNFILGDVNKTVSRWVANDTVTVCNSARCLLMIYHPSGKHFTVGTPFSNTGGPYKNSSSSSGFGGGGDDQGESGQECSPDTGYVEHTWITWSGCNGGQCESGSTYVGSEVVGTDGSNCL